MFTQARPSDSFHDSAGPRYAKVAFRRKGSNCLMLTPLTLQGFPEHSTVRRPDGQPLTNAQPGDPLEVDGEQVTIDTVEFSQPARW